MQQSIQKDDPNKGIHFIVKIMLGIFLFLFLFPNNDVAKMIKTDGISEISCGSDSMGLSLTCKQEARWHYVQEDERLIPGDIYIYTPQGNNYTNVAHRLVGCVQVDGHTIREKCEYLESYLIFKGDNNAVMDIPIQYTDEIRLRYVDIIYND